MDEVKPFCAIDGGLWGEIERIVEGWNQFETIVMVYGRIGEEILKLGLMFCGIVEQSIEANFESLLLIVKNRKNLIQNWVPTLNISGDLQQRQFSQNPATYLVKGLHWLRAPA